MKEYGGTAAVGPLNGNVSTNSRRVASFTQRRFTSTEIVRVSHWIGRWLGPTAGL